MRQQQPARIAGGLLDRYFHVCAFFNSAEEEDRVLLPFVLEGMLNREKAVHIWDPALLEAHAQSLKLTLGAAGIDVASSECAGQLAILSTDDVYLQGGSFEVGRMLQTIEGAIAQGREQGFQRSRILGHMEWALKGHPGSSQLLEFEIKVNDVLARTEQPAVCIYDVNLLSAKQMMDLLRAHPLTIVNGVLHENPFFTPAEQYLRELQPQREGPRAIA